MLDIKPKLIVFDWNGTLSTGLETDASDVAALYDGVITMLKELNTQGYLLAIATNMPKAQLQSELYHYHMCELFVYLATPDNGFAKPNPEMLLQIFDFTGVDAADAIMVGDSPSDMQTAINANCAAIGVDHTKKYKDFLLAAGASLVLDDVAKLEEYMQIQG